MINLKPVNGKNLSPDTREKLVRYYGIISALYLVPIEKVPKLFGTVENYNTTITEIETIIQTLWTFEPNTDCHRMRFEDPKCLCPKTDNRERFGVPYKIINQECELHEKS